jgi:SEC-C motif domain protein
MDACPCGTGRGYAHCCGPFHAGSPAPEAAALMRSRYSAYVLQREDYLLATWHPATRPAALQLDAAPAPARLGLEVRRHEEATGADTARVEFVARHRAGGGRAVRLHETSRFVREGGRWFYLDGVLH